MRKKLHSFLIFGACLSVGPSAMAGDHGDAPGTQADSIADLASLYAWHAGNGRTIVALTFRPNAGASGMYDDQALYQIHIDSNDDGISDRDISVRFGQNGASEWGVQVTGLPGEATPVVGAVETTITAGGGAMVYAGLRDDPLFFDRAGYDASLANDTFSFSGADAYQGQNVMAIVIEASSSAIADGTTGFQVWATSGRL